MNKVFLIGNLVRDPETKTTQSGVSLCVFTIAVNRRRANTAQAGQPEADFFRITAWRQLGEICSKYLAKGRKVSVTGSVSASAYQGNDGQPRASLEVQADDVEFLTPKNETAQDNPSHDKPYEEQLPIPDNRGFVQVDEEDLPF